jgi:hypothetical protein
LRRADPPPSKRKGSPVPGFQYHYICSSHTSEPLLSRVSLRCFQPQRVGELRHVTTQIWIEPVKRPDGSDWYSSRNGLLLRSRLGGPHGEILCDGVHNPICESCRVLMSLGITGPFETWKQAFRIPACGATSRGRRSSLWRREAPSLPGSEGGNHTPTLRMPFPVRAGQHQRARTMGPVGC